MAHPDASGFLTRRFRWELPHRAPTRPWHADCWRAVTPIEEMTMRNSYPLTSLTVLALATLVACGTSTSEKTSAPDENTTNGVQKLMQRASSCDDLDYALRAEARLQLAKQIEQSQPSVASGAARWGGVGGSATMVPSNAASGGVKSATGQAVAIGDSADSASGAGESPNYSETNTQVKGID